VPKQLPSKRKWIRRTALSWAIPMTILFWAMLWSHGALDPGMALGVLAIAIACGFGFASALYNIVKNKYGLTFKDED
jgi:hypothetical protein